MEQDHQADMKVYDQQLIKIRDDMTSKEDALISAKKKIKQKEE